jgi:hypothetical protein
VEQERRVLPPGYSISFAAEKIPRMDGITGKSDPFLMVYAAPVSFELKINIIKKYIL